ncbi:MAG: hypothetical protein FWE37_02215 [Spirochaetaceae bacterium]|nr:hypothetical protein [Spirochaetaceae bacterium]
MALKANTINITCKVMAVVAVLLGLILKAMGIIDLPMSEVIMAATFVAAAFVGVDISKVGVAIKSCKEGENAKKD